MGASGRVGRLIASAWANRDSPWHTVPLQYRRPQTLFHSRIIPWDVADGPDGLLYWMDRFGTLETLIVMAGVTPATSSDMTLNTVIAKAYNDARRWCQYGWIQKYPRHFSRNPAGASRKPYLLQSLIRLEQVAAEIHPAKTVRAPPLRQNVLATYFTLSPCPRPIAVARIIFRSSGIVRSARYSASSFASRSGSLISTFWI